MTIPDSVTSIGGSAFRECISLERVTISDSVTSIGYSTFSECTSLSRIKIPESVTSIGGYAFSECSELSQIVFTEGLKSIGDYAFSLCSSLRHVVIPEGVESIGNDTFSLCSSLHTVILPDGITSLGHSVFDGCQDLSVVYFKGSRPNSVGWHPFTGANNGAKAMVTSAYLSSFGGVGRLWNELRVVEAPSDSFFSNMTEAGLAGEDALLSADPEHRGVKNVVAYALGSVSYTHLTLPTIA